MKIKYVEELVGISRKNIRFYEEEGLLSPDRAENGYREYGQEDIDRLMQVKLLRKLGVSIENIKRVLNDETRLEDCLDSHLDELERQKENLTKIQTVSRQIIESHASLQPSDTESWLDLLEQMEKEGMNFMSTEKTDVRQKKRIGTILAGVVVMVLNLAVPALVLWADTIDPIPSVVIWLSIIFPVIAAVGTILAVVQRMKEIEGGEEDEAVKY